jgi:RimJ/RimL family protein N-acetyltransferase
MLKYILKLWSHNIDWFDDAIRLHESKNFFGVELYNQVDAPYDWDSLEKLKAANVVSIHHSHNHGWHDYWLTPEQENLWKQTITLVDFFSARSIIVHPARTHTSETFAKELTKIDDSRILIENMSGLDRLGRPMFGASIDDIRNIMSLRPICFDLEKATKAAQRFGVHYKNYITQCLEEFSPDYFHLSGGFTNNAVDEHRDIWDSNMDMVWIKKILEDYSKNKDCFVAFEVPKNNGLENDIKNIDWFDLVAEKSLDFRRANLSDSDFLFSLRNDPDVRKQSFQTGEVERKVHDDWFLKILADNKRFLYIILDSSKNSVGQLRFDINNKDAEVSFSLHKIARGKGLGAQVLIAGIEHFVAEYPQIEKLTARAKKDNMSSVISLQRAGFVKDREEDNVFSFNYSVLPSI